MTLGVVSVHRELLSKVEIDRLVRGLHRLAFDESNLWISQLDKVISRDKLL
jgi:hypothetical protein